jgi:hypothetical protein
MIPQNLLDAITGTLYSSSLAKHQVYFFEKATPTAVRSAPHRTIPTAHRLLHLVTSAGSPPADDEPTMFRDNNVIFVTTASFFEGNAAFGHLPVAGGGAAHPNPRR